MKYLITTILAFFLFLIDGGTPAIAADEILPGNILHMSITVGGMERTYLAYIPSGELSSPALFIILHGSLGTGEKMREASGYQFDRLAESRKCISVYPDGFGKHWNDCRTVPGDDAHTRNIDDVGFVKALIEDCRARWRIDPSRVYAAGLSNGGHMCFRLASEIPDRIAGIAVIGACMPLPSVSRCPAPGPGLQVMIINGTDDPINPFEGGMVKLLYLFRKGEVMSSLDSARTWLKEENRGKEPVRVQMEDRDPSDNTHIEQLVWPGDRVALYIVHGGGHTIPCGKQYLPRFIIGRTSRDMDTAQEIWRFFSDAGQHK